MEVGDGRREGWCKRLGLFGSLSKQWWVRERERERELLGQAN